MNSISWIDILNVINGINWINIFNLLITSVVTGIVIAYFAGMFAAKFSIKENNKKKDKDFILNVNKEIVYLLINFQKYMNLLEIINNVEKYNIYDKNVLNYDLNKFDYLNKNIFLESYNFIEKNKISTSIKNVPSEITDKFKCFTDLERSIKCINEKIESEKFNKNEKAFVLRFLMDDYVFNLYYLIYIYEQCLLNSGSCYDYSNIDYYNDLSGAFDSLINRKISHYELFSLKESNIEKAIKEFDKIKKRRLLSEECTMFLNYEFKNKYNLV